MTPPIAPSAPSAPTPFEISRQIKSLSSSLLDDGSNFSLYEHTLSIFLCKEQNDCLKTAASTATELATDKGTTFILLTTMAMSDSMAAKSLTNSAAIWTYLKEKYQSTSALSKYGAKIAFHENTIGEEENVLSYVQSDPHRPPDWIASKTRKVSSTERPTFRLCVTAYWMTPSGSMMNSPRKATPSSSSRMP